MFCINAAAAVSYSMTKIAALGETAPGGSQYFFDFEVSGQFNNRGDILYVADLSNDGVTGIGEGLFLRPVGGSTIALSLPEQIAPSGGTFLGGGWSPTGINAQGDAAAALVLSPFTLPVGMNSGLYRYSAASGTFSAAVVPGVTSVPGVGTLLGVYFQTPMNNRGDIVFPAIFATTDGILPSQGLGLGVFLAPASGPIQPVIVPGQPAPGGGTFSFAENPSINSLGDVAVGANLATDPDVEDPTLSNQGNRIFSGENIYLKRASGQIIRIVQQGEAAPGGGIFRHEWGPIINDRRQILFEGDLTPAPAVDQVQGLFLYTGSAIVPVVRPGDSLPDGRLATAADYTFSHHINNRGEVSFLALLDNGTEAIYVKSGTSFQLVAKTGTIIPGVGTIVNFDTFAMQGVPSSGAVNNDRGQVIFSANLTSGSAALIIATPHVEAGTEE
jgi:hypothetical protein